MTSAHNAERVDKPIILYSEQFTDVLTLEIPTLPSVSLLNNKDSISYHSVYSAWNSLSEILAQSIRRKQDIERSEISAGLRVYSDLSTSERSLKYGVYLSDNLDNGAGYCSYFSNKERLQELLEYSWNRFNDLLLSPDHLENCSSSCYKCLRNYENRFIHNALDWRLGHDLLSLSVNQDYVPSLTHNKWNNLLEKFFIEWINAVLIGQKFELSRYKEAVYYYCKKDGVIILPIHPLTDPNDMSVKSLALKLSEEKGTVFEKVFRVDVLQFTKNPSMLTKFLKRM